MKHQLMQEDQVELYNVLFPKPDIKEKWEGISRALQTIGSVTAALGISSTEAADALAEATRIARERAGVLANELFPWDDRLVALHRLEHYALNGPPNEPVMTPNQLREHYALYGPKFIKLPGMGVP